MSAFMKTLLSLSLSGTLVFLLLKLLKPLYREKFSRRWQYYIWLVAALRFLIPFSPDGTLMNNGRRNPRDRRMGTPAGQERPA